MQKIDTDVGKLVSMIEGGELRLPEMQRRYVLRRLVRDLLDPNEVTLRAQFWFGKPTAKCRAEISLCQGNQPFQRAQTLTRWTATSHFIECDRSR